MKTKNTTASGGATNPINGGTTKSTKKSTTTSSSSKSSSSSKKSNSSSSSKTSSSGNTSTQTSTQTTNGTATTYDQKAYDGSQIAANYLAALSQGYTPAEAIAVTNPTLMNTQEYLAKLGLSDYQYNYNDILNNLNNATDAGYASTKNELANANAEYNRNMAAQQQSVADSIRNQQQAAVSTGMTKGMQAAQMLSSLLGNSQTSATGAQELASNRYQSALDYASQLREDASSALDKSNAAQETLMSNIRQLYNDDIQQKTADLEYNASVNETNANYASQIASAAASAASSDNYASAYQNAANGAAAINSGGKITNNGTGNAKSKDTKNKTTTTTKTTTK